MIIETFIGVILLFFVKTWVELVKNEAIFIPLPINTVRKIMKAAKISKKEAWMNKVRALRKRLRELKAKKVIAESTYRKLYTMVKSGRFASVADMERFLKAHDLWRKR